MTGQDPTYKWDPEPGCWSLYIHYGVHIFLHASAFGRMHVGSARYGFEWFHRTPRSSLLQYIF